MKPLPQKLIDALRQLDARAAALVEGWMLGQDLPDGQWVLSPDKSRIELLEAPCDSSSS